MFLSQIASNSRKSINNYLVLLRVNQTCRSGYKEFYKHQTMFYCYFGKQSRIDVKPNKSDKINDNGSKKINWHTQQHVDSFIKTSNFTDPKKSMHYIEKLYPSPTSNLCNIFNIVNNEFNKQCISFTYTDVDHNNKKCIIDIVWPHEMSFSSVAYTKKIARHNTALKCLQWLYENKRIKQSKPLLYTKQDMRDILESQQTIAINLESQRKNEIKLLIDTFENSIQSIVTDQSSAGFKISSKLEEEELETNTLSGFSDKRNEKLIRGLQERKGKICSLPVYNHREEILDALKHNRVLLIKGDTGCGKSTQIPQFILDAYTEENRAKECNIIVSQPRRVGAISLAHRIAKERNEHMGDVVGYHVRFENMEPRMLGSILFYTTGLLLRTLERNPTLEGVSHVIVDEAHERSLQIDLLLKLLKNILQQNPTVKLIIMSATMNADLFQRYFSCKVIEIPGKLYPVKMHFKEDIEIFKNELKQNIRNKLEIPFDKIVKLVQWILRDKPPGGILCFLPGWQEIKQLHDLLQNENINNVLILPLHSKVPHYIQQKAFEDVPENVTKIILATDIAESSITIKEISYVIDTGVKKEKKKYEDDSVPVLEFSLISKANLHQRRGRAGRVKPGESYHLITKDQYHLLDMYPKPEIRRMSLDDTIIISKKLSDEKIHDFFNSMLEPPSNVLISHAINNLKKFGFLDENENLTSLGKRVSYFSLDLKLAKAIVLSCVFQCLNPILLLTCLRFGESPAVSLDEGLSEKSTVKTHKLAFHKTSDHIAALQYFNYWESCKNLNEDFYKPSSFSMVKKYYKLHAGEAVDSGMLGSTSEMEIINEYSENNELIRAVLFMATNHLIKRTAYGFKAGHFTKFANNLWTEKNEMVRLINESVNYNRKEWPSEILTYLRKMRFSRGYAVSDTSMLTPLSVLLFSNNEIECYKDEESLTTETEKLYIRINDINNLEFCCDRETAQLLVNLREILWSVVNYIIEYEGVKSNEDNLKLVKSFKMDLISLLSSMLCESSKDIDDAK